MTAPEGSRLQRLRDLPKFLRAPRAAGLWLIGILIPIATLASFIVSYRGLFEWALHHGWPWYLAPALPLIVDLLIICGEIVLFVAAVDGGTPWRVRLWAWSVTVGFTALSIAGNVSHAATHDLATRVGWGLPPAGIAIALGFGLGELKRQADKYRDAAPARPAAGTVPSSVLEAAEMSMAATVAAGNPLSANQLQERFGLSRTQATKIRTAVLPPVLPDPGHTLNGDGPHE